MHIKKITIIFLCISILLQFVTSYSNYKIEIILTEKTLKAGEDIAFRINLYDSENNLLNKNINITILDIKETKKIEKIVNSKEIILINLGENAKQGQWKIIANYEEIQTEENFFIEAKEELSFNIENDLLIIKNTGNIDINEEIQIVIGENIGEPKNLKLEIGEEEKYRLIAPEGTYKIKIISDKGTLFSKSNIKLNNKGFTGQSIGAINEEQKKGGFLTGGISPDEEADEAFLYYVKNSKIVYAFIFVIFAATILLTIARKLKSAN
jgi:hypothetical protein